MEPPQRINKVLFAFFALFIFGSTFSIALAQMSFGLALIVFLVIVARTGHNPFVSPLKAFYLLIGSYVVWEFVAALAGETPSASAIMLREEWLFCIVPVGIYLFRYEHFRHHLMTALAAGVLLVSIYALIQHFTGANWFRGGNPLVEADFGYRAQGNFSHRLTFGNYYATAAPFLIGYGIVRGDDISHNRRLLFTAAGLLALIAAALSYSRGPILAMAATMILAGVILGRKYLLRSLAVIVVAGIMVMLTMPSLVSRFTDVKTRDMDTSYEGGRLFIWNNTLTIIGDNPILGVGAGNFYHEYVALLRPDIPDIRKRVHAHNDVLNAAAVNGIPGGLLFLGVWSACLGLFSMGWHRRARFPDGYARFSMAALLGSVAFFLASMTEATFADEEVRQLLMFVWAAGLWPWYKKMSDSPEAKTA